MIYDHPFPVGTHVRVKNPNPTRPQWNGMIGTILECSNGTYRVQFDYIPPSWWDDKAYFFEDEVEAITEDL